MSFSKNIRIKLLSNFNKNIKLEDTQMGKDVIIACDFPSQEATLDFLKKF